MNFAAQLHDAETMRLHSQGLCRHRWTLKGHTHTHECGLPVSRHGDYHDCHFCSVGFETTLAVKK